MGSTLFQPGNDLFWLLQWLQGKSRGTDGAIDNSLLKQYNYLLNSQEPYSVDPYANYWAFSNSDPAPSRRRRAAVEEEALGERAAAEKASLERAAAGKAYVGEAVEPE